MWNICFLSQHLNFKTKTKIVTSLKSTWFIKPYHTTTTSSKRINKYTNKTGNWSFTSPLVWGSEFMLTSGIPRTGEIWKWSWYALQLAARSKGETLLASTNTRYSTTWSLSNLNKASLAPSCNAPPMSKRLGPSSTKQGVLISLGFKRNLKSKASENPKQNQQIRLAM